LTTECHSTKFSITIFEKVLLKPTMHISEGILSAPVLIGGGILAASGTIIGLKKVNYEHIMPTALLSSAFFVASLIHVPLGPGSVHLVLNGLLGIILGWAAFPAILTGLFLQAVFFQFGGLVVLGVNTVTMAVPALCCFYFARPLLKKARTRPVAAFLAGAGAVFLSALCMAFALALSDTGFLATARLILVANIPVMIIEGCITLFTVSFLARVQPEILHLHNK
jgi:cobalt/nickel transport system permease protein